MHIFSANNSLHQWHLHIGQNVEHNYFNALAIDNIQVKDIEPTCQEKKNRITKLEKTLFFSLLITSF